MNRRLSEAQHDAYLGFMRDALLEARSACWRGDQPLATALVDMLHNLPGFLAAGGQPGYEDWSAQGYYDLFVAPVRERYPQLHVGWDALPR